MPFKLIMPRKAFAKVQVMCDEYEEKFEEKIPTARLVNVLLCEALIHRELIPKGFIKEKYGSDNPIEEGFTARARELSSGITREAKLQREAKTVEMTKKFSQVIEQWDTLKPEAQKYYTEKAREYENSVSNAKYLLALANGETVSLKATENGESSQ